MCQRTWGRDVIDGVSVYRPQLPIGVWGTSTSLYISSFIVNPMTHRIRETFSLPRHSMLFVKDYLHKILFGLAHLSLFQ